MYIHNTHTHTLDTAHCTTVRALPAVGAGVEHAEALVQHADGLVLVGRVVVGVVALAQREAGLELWNAFGNTTGKRPPSLHLPTELDSMHLVLYSPTPPAGMHQGAAGARRLASSSSRAGAVMAGAEETLGGES